MNIHYVELFDYYGDLFTDKQKDYFIDYYFNNYSLKEIANNYNVSRNAVFKILKDVEEKLDYYEAKLNLYDKGKKVKVLISNLDSDLKEKIEELI